MKISKKIKYIRIIRGYTTKELSELTGINHTALRKYETGANIPTGDRLTSLMHALQIEEGILSNGYMFPETIKTKGQLGSIILQLLKNGILTIEKAPMHKNDRAKTYDDYYRYYRLVTGKLFKHNFTIKSRDDHHINPNLYIKFNHFKNWPLVVMWFNMKYYDLSLNECMDDLREVIDDFDLSDRRYGEFFVSRYITHFSNEFKTKDDLIDFIELLLSISFKSVK